MPRLSEGGGAQREAAQWVWASFPSESNGISLRRAIHANSHGFYLDFPQKIPVFPSGCMDFFVTASMPSSWIFQSTMDAQIHDGLVNPWSSSVQDPLFPSGKKNTKIPPEFPSGKESMLHSMHYPHKKTNPCKIPFIPSHGCASEKPSLSTPLHFPLKKTESMRNSFPSFTFITLRKALIHIHAPSFHLHIIHFSDMDMEDINARM